MQDYARTDAPEQPNLDVVILGNRICARTLDLNLPWEQLRAELDAIPELLEVPPAHTGSCP